MKGASTFSGEAIARNAAITYLSEENPAHALPGPGAL